MYSLTFQECYFIKRCILEIVKLMPFKESILVAKEVPEKFIQAIALNHTDLTYEPQHKISNNVICATSKDSDQPAHMRSLIRAFASRLNIL